ncbi:MAG: single-stranded-DNA-specific exonuclease RecJ [Spirochaetaceae bacterium]|jgi:single-stranded-DNA-specific exonuclease|nr:single-stranded-DNA-specific exonuclease RecJ [Spirochaetaceae bacterium]
MNWEKKDVPAELVRELASKYGCDLLAASVFARRGLLEGGELRYFLEDDPRHLHNPFELPGMEDAVDRILVAKDGGEKVLVFGDRDVDGITSTALICSALAKQGMKVSWRLPTGNDTYGLSVKAVEEFAAAGGTLIITVDCGISNLTEARRAAELGVDMIITDHHNPQDELPEALAIVNPKLKDSRYPFRDLAGCGVAYKLASALRFAQKSRLYGHDICLFNQRPVNNAYVVEIAKLRNLSLIDRLVETIVPGMVDIGNTRIPAFLEGQSIFVWDAPLQKKTLEKIFGSGAEPYMPDILDLAPQIAEEIPPTAGKSLLRIKELSRIARYTEKNLTELDLFINLFTSFVHKKEKTFDADDYGELQLAALGTIADIMPLRNENRIIVKTGLDSLMKKPRPGLSELLYKLEFSGKRIGASDISWNLCPAINASGRMGNAAKAAALLLEENPRERDKLADEVISMNEERKKVGQTTWAAVEPLAEKSLEHYGGNMVLAAGETIFRGVTGIMANSLISRFKVPALVVSFNEEIATGSFRSLRGYNVRGLLEQCADLFIDWGGHDFAAGFSMPVKNWDTFLERLENAAQTIELGSLEDEETINIDAELPHGYITPDIFTLVDRFEPCGEANPPLVFMARGLKIVNIDFVGKNGAKHAKLTLDTGKHKWPAMYWQAADKVREEFDLNDKVDLVFKFSRNWFNGIETPQIIITDLRRAQGA